MNEIYKEVAVSVFKKLITEVSGKVVYDIYPQADTIIFKVFFKDFKFGYAFTHVNERVCLEGTPSSDLVEEFKTAYTKFIFNSFFKTEKRKGE